MRVEMRIAANSNWMEYGIGEKGNWWQKRPSRLWNRMAQYIITNCFMYSYTPL